MGLALDMPYLTTYELMDYGTVIYYNLFAGLSM